MNVYYITFRSVTHAQKGERVLSGAGIRCHLQRTPRWMEEQGCGYCLRLTGENPAPAVQLLKARRIPMRKVYVQGESGAMEELSL